MKSNVFRYVAVIAGSLAVISVCAVLLVVLQPDDELPVDTGISTSKPEMDGQTFEDWSEEYLNLRASRLAEEEARKSTTARQTTTTTKRVRQTAPVYTVAEPSRSATATAKPTTTTTATTAQKASKTTRLATEAEKEIIYRSVSAEAIEIYEEYKAEMLTLIAEIDAEIARKEATIDAYYAQYEQEAAKYWSETAKISLYNTYQNMVAPIGKEISELEALKESIQADLAEAESQLDSIIQEKYEAAVEEFQQQTLS